MKITKIRKNVDKHEWGCNPCCFTGDMRLLTTEGYKTFESLVDTPINLINKDGDASIGRVWVSGEKEIVELRFIGEKDSITCTPDHVFMTADGEEIEAQYLRGKRLFPYFTIKSYFPTSAFKAGFIQGDGNTTRLLSSRHKGLEVYFGSKDQDIADIFGTTAPNNFYSREAKKIASIYGLSPAILPERAWPTFSFTSGDIKTFHGEKAEFLAGLYSANGSVITSAKRVALKTTCKELADRVKTELLEFGVYSYITINKAKKIKFENGEYTCRQSYDVNIVKHDSLINFAETISFGQQYKRDALRQIILETAPMVRSVHKRGIAVVYDYNEPLTNWGIVEGVVVHNSEIVLRPRQLCNLSEVVVRPEDNLATLREKVRIATILGTLQSTLTDFRYLSKEWKKNCEEERLLGVSLTGIMDHPVLNGSGNVFDYEDTTYSLEAALEDLRNVAIETNKEWSEKLGINPSAAITCVKPSGTVSQLVDSASGIHPRYASYYIRTVRSDNKDPITTFMKNQGVPWEPDITKPEITTVFSFPMKSPEGSIIRDNLSAMEQLNLWKIYQDYWCEHKPSQTVYYKDTDFMDVGAWVYKNFDTVSGISFLPHTNHSYKQAPYQEITKEKYDELIAKMPVLDWSKLSEFETEDMTDNAKELACSANGGCEIL